MGLFTKHEKTDFVKNQAGEIREIERDTWRETPRFKEKAKKIYGEWKQQRGKEKEAYKTSYNEERIKASSEAGRRHARNRFDAFRQPQKPKIIYVQAKPKKKYHHEQFKQINYNRRPPKRPRISDPFDIGRYFND